MGDPGSPKAIAKLLLTLKEPKLFPKFLFLVELNNMFPWGRAGLWGQPRRGSKGVGRLHCT